MLTAISCNHMKAYNRLKILTSILLVLGLLVEAFLVFDGYQEANNRSDLVGAARAQSEFFLMGLVLIGRPIAIAGIILLILNLVADIRYSSIKKLNNLFVYIGLIAMVCTPLIAPDILLNVLYEGHCNEKVS